MCVYKSELYPEPEAYQSIILYTGRYNKLNVPAINSTAFFHSIYFSLLKIAEVITPAGFVLAKTFNNNICKCDNGSIKDTILGTSKQEHNKKQKQNSCTEL